MDPVAIAHFAAKAALDKKATRLCLQDVRGLSDLCQFQLICSAQNEKQTRAICQNIEESLRKVGQRPMAIEGKQSGQWILVDYGSLIVHIFENYLRDHYCPEELWADAKFVDLSLTQLPPTA
jgi:ribosome-associated protein